MVIKKSTLALPFLFFALLFSAGSAHAQINSSKYAALVVNADNGTILHQRNANALRYPASLTKMMTLYLAFDAIETGKLRPNMMLRVSSNAASQSPLKLGLRAGQQISVRDAMMGLIVKSANDASVVLAEAIAGSEWQFARQMTAKARELGMNNTTFKNASGLPNPQQVSTAVDLAKLGIALKRDYPDFFPMFSTTSFKFRGARIESHNRVVKNYRGATGLKTGYVNASGFNLITTATRNNVNLVGVVLGGVTAKKRDAHMISLLDNGFAKLGVTQQHAKTNTEKKSTASAQKKQTQKKAVAQKKQPSKKAVAQKKQNKQPKFAEVKRQRAWAIQVGKYNRERDAINAVAHAMDLAGDHLEASKVSFTRNKAKKVHTAKLANLTESQARNACSALRSARESCQVVRLYN